MREELIQLKKPIPLSYEEQINKQFELAKKLLPPLEKFRKEEPELYRFLNQAEPQAISTANPMWIKWIFLATTELFWLYMTSCPEDLKLVRDDGDGESFIDSDVAELISFKTGCILKEGLNYFDLTATEVTLLNEEIVKDDRKFYTTRTKIPEQLRDYEAEKSYWNLSGLIWSYLELGRVDEAIRLLENVKPENDLEPDQMADFLLLYTRLIDLTTYGGSEFATVALEDENILRLMHHLTKQQESFEVFDQQESLKVRFAWLKLIEKLVVWNEKKEKLTPFETHLKNSHDQLLVTLFNQFENPIELLSVYSCFSLSDQYQLERDLLTQKFPDKLGYFRFRSCFFKKNALWKDFEPMHWDFRDQICEQLLREFPVSEKAIQICYLSVLWEQELTYWDVQVLTAVKTIKAFGGWFQNLKENGIDQEFDYQDARILRWLLKSWIITDAEQPIQEMMEFLFDNLDFCRRWLEGMLGILFSRSCYDLIIDVGENILRIAEFQDQLSPAQIDACEMWLMVMAWTYAFQNREDEIEELCKICETRGKRLMIDEGCIAEIKAIKNGESWFFYEDPDALLQYD